MTGESDPHLELACAAARKAGELLRQRFGSIGDEDIEYKSEIEIVTSADRQSQQIIVDALRAGFPEIPVIAEEDDWTGREFPADAWVVDPLDGTSNFAHGLSRFCVSIALVLGNRRELGVVYAPLSDELFTAARGRGAHLNGRSIHTSGTAVLKQSLVGSGFPYDAAKYGRDNLREWAAVTRAVLSTRCHGASALDLCYVACGRLDAFWELDLEPWDMAAGTLIVEEAGGVVTDANGRAFSVGGRTVLATNGRLHEGMVGLVRAR